MKIATVLLAGCALVPGAALASPGWEWIVAPYGWFAGVTTDLHTDLPPPGSGVDPDIDRDFDNILDKIDGAFEIHVEGQGEHFGVFTDFTYLGLADSHDFRRFHTESDLDTRLFELAGVWNPSGERFKGFEVFAGLRYIGVDFTGNFVPLNPAFGASSTRVDETFSDFMLGGRYHWPISDRWGVTFRGDGSWGETEGTWNVSAVANYRTQHGAWYFGYRYLHVAVEPNEHRLDLAIDGPLVGYGFRF